MGFPIFKVTKNEMMTRAEGDQVGLIEFARPVNMDRSYVVGLKFFCCSAGETAGVFQQESTPKRGPFR